MSGYSRLEPCSPRNVRSPVGLQAALASVSRDSAAAGRAPGAARDSPLPPQRWTPAASAGASPASVFSPSAVTPSTLTPTARTLPRSKARKPAGNMGSRAAAHAPATVHVGGIQRALARDEPRLRQMVQRFGEVLVQSVRVRDDGEASSWALVTFRDAHEAQDAEQGADELGLHGLEIRMLDVEAAVSSTGQMGPVIRAHMSKVFKVMAALEEENVLAQDKKSAAAAAWAEQAKGKTNEAIFEHETLAKLKSSLPAEQFTFVEEGWKQIIAEKRRQREVQRAECDKFRYGEILFEETGSVVPYLLIPDTEEGQNPQLIMKMMIEHLRKDGRPLTKPNIAFRVRARGKSYLEWAVNIWENPFLCKVWGWHNSDHEQEPGATAGTAHAQQKYLHLHQPSTCDEAIRDFGERLLGVFKDVVQGVVNSRGWFLFPAGRRPRHQLIGDTIDEFGGDLESCIWVQYNTLRNRSMFKRYPIHQSQEDKRRQRLREQLEEMGQESFADTHGVNLETLRGRILDTQYPRPAAVTQQQESGGETALLREAAVEAVALQQMKEAWHEDFVAEVRRCARPLEEHGQTPNVTRVTYPAELEEDGSVIYPNLGSVQGAMMKDGRECSVAEWLQQKCDNIGDKDIVLHPRTTHLLFWDKPGTRRGGGQYLPWTDVDTLHGYLSSIGVAEGALVCNGDISDFQNIVSLVKKSSPVLAVKSVGGASEKIAAVFEARQRLNPAKKPGEAPNRPQGYSPPYPPEVISDDFQKVAFTVGEQSNAEDREMIVVDAVNPAVGQVVQKQMAELLTMSGGAEERQIGFAACERARFCKAWNLAMLYQTNAQSQKVTSDFLNYVSFLLAVLVVVIVVIKQMLLMEQTGGGNEEHHDLEILKAIARENVRVCELNDEGLAQLTDALVYGVCSDEKEDDSAATVPKDVEQLADILQLLLVVLPMVSGVLLTLNNAFHPMQKYNALRWAAIKIQCEIYIYRSRSLTFSHTSNSAEWAIEAEEVAGATAQQREQIAKTFVKSVESVSAQISSETDMQVASLSYFDETPKLARNQRRDDIPEQQRLKDGTTASDNDENQAAKYTTGMEARMKEIFGLPRAYIGEPSADELDQFETIVDNGFENLGADEYVVCRTKPQMKLMQRRLQPLARRKALLMTCVYLATAASVMMGTLHLNLYIAITQAVVGLVTSLLEYQRLETTIVILNNSVRDLSHLLIWWDSLSFVEKRMPLNKNRLVEVTETAIVAETSQSYQNLPTDLGTSEDNGEAQDGEAAA